MTHCAVCCKPKPDYYYRACEKCRAGWRKAKSDTKEYWIILMADPVLDGKTNASLHDHNCVADYRDHKRFIGMKHVKVNMRNLQK